MLLIGRNLPPSPGLTRVVPQVAPQRAGADPHQGKFAQGQQKAAL